MAELKHFIDIFSNYRNYILKLLLYPCLFVLFCSKFSPESIEKIYYFLPKTNWLSGTIEAVKIYLQIIAYMLFGFLLLSILVLFLALLFRRVVLKNYEDWELNNSSWVKSISYCGYLLLESSLWWCALFCVQILYKTNTIEELFYLSKDALLKVPTLIFAILHLYSWFSGGKSNFKDRGFGNVNT
ncbi:hypothetical protein C8Z91_04470 [Paenibacillus elgii]|uniref:Uncharacterized protein n=1 Tax=Paenibacillus elgii TaxID=189691 RepID=A0A2T6G888_9BACL|nr:hypothetical protein [Paenibacillus elgii]PUA40364.1 hypothetical protein C8Z91_04470 [Paenibacillus elgii]